MDTLIPYDKDKVDVSIDDYEEYYILAHNILKSYLFNIDYLLRQDKTKDLVELALIKQINHLASNDHLLEEVGGISSLSVISFNISFSNNSTLILQLTSRPAYLLIRDLISSRLDRSCSEVCL